MQKHIDEWLDFYPRPPRGGRHRALDSLMDKWDISIHALREEGDRTAGEVQKASY